MSLYLSLIYRVASLRRFGCVVAVLASLMVWNLRADEFTYDMGNLETVPLFLSSNHEQIEGILRVVNHSKIDGFITILACDDAGNVHRPIAIPTPASATLYIDSNDLEAGNIDKGIPTGIGKGQGDWHLYIRSLLDIEVMAYVASTDGFLTAIQNSVIPDHDERFHVSLFNVNAPNSYLRLINGERESIEVNVEFTDRFDESSIASSKLRLNASEARKIEIADLIFHSNEIRAAISSLSPPISLKLDATFTTNALRHRPLLYVMHLKKVTERYISNLSTQPTRNQHGTAQIPFLPSPSDPFHRSGLLRLTNTSRRDGQIRVVVLNESGEALSALKKTIRARETIEISSLELDKVTRSQRHDDSLPSHQSSWRLELHSNLTIEMAAYLLTAEGTIAPIHDVVTGAGNRYRLPTVISPRRRDQKGIVRIVNPSQSEAKVEIRPINRKLASKNSVMHLSLLPGHTKELAASDLTHTSSHEASSLDPRDEISEWFVNSQSSIVVQSMLVNNNGQVSNLSSAPKSYGYEDEFPGSDLMHVYNDNVLVMHVDHDVTEPLESPPIRYASEIYRRFDDVFDFLILLPNVDNWYSTNESIFGTYYAVMNDVEGIGRTQFLDTRYGSAGRLRGVITLNFSRALIHGPLLHELQHAWANFVIPTSVSSHWGFSSANGQLGGFDRTQLTTIEDGVYFAGISWNPRANGGNSVPYSPIELYLAGFLEPEHVPDTWVAPTGQWFEPEQIEPDSSFGTSLFTADFTRIYSIDDIINKHGERIPNADHAPRLFRAAVVLLVDERQPLFKDDIAIVSEHARIFSEPKTVDYMSCRFRDLIDKYPYTHQCSNDVTRTWSGARIGGTAHLFYNYFEATGGRATLTLDGLSDSITAR